MGWHPNDGPVATFCLPLSASNKLRPNHHVGMLMWAALGLPIEMPICSRSQLLREEKMKLWLLDPVSLMGWLGGEWPLQAVSSLFWLCPPKSVGRVRNAGVHHVFSLRLVCLYLAELGFFWVEGLLIGSPQQKWAGNREFESQWSVLSLINTPQ